MEQIVGWTAGGLVLAMVIVGVVRTLRSERHLGVPAGEGRLTRPVEVIRLDRVLIALGAALAVALVAYIVLGLP
ncbi:hypothetical protein [Nakamurella panacisegetis]|nr:hypothetical protein [Nakamurella panacisegetis]